MSEPTTAAARPSPVDEVQSDQEWNTGILTPRSPRGIRTQERMIAAARVVFVRDGFVDAKITDITAEAGVSSGSFYTYFDSKEAIFIAAIKEVNQRLYVAATPAADAPRDPLLRFEHTTRAYIHAYQEHRGLLAILEQVATINPRFREMRRGIRQIFRERSERNIRRLQEKGLIDPTLSPRCTAEALTSMVSNFCYVWLVLGEDYEEDEAIRTLTTIWSSGIGLRSSGS